jgi:A/G-specific adenine glycosylase
VPPKNIKQFRKNLLRWFDIYQRKLPWRETDDPYHIWISEVMLQQTQVKKVLEYYQKFVDRFPTIHALAEADLQDVLKTWEGLGYYARARNLHKAAQAVVAEMNAEIPSDYATFRKLPGVGDYIAAAVQSIAFNVPYAVVDGNVKRVLARLFLIDAPINQSASAKIFQEKADLLLDPDTPGGFNPAMMELGATICRPKSPTCLVCPVNELCGAFVAGRESEYPVRVKSKPTPEYHHAVGVIEKEGRVLITQRPRDGLLGGLWEFPGVEIDSGETTQAACLRGMGEVVNISVEIIDFLTQVRHAYTHFKVVVDVFRCRHRSGEVVLNGPVDYRWIRLDEIEAFPFPRVNHKFMPLLRGDER